MGEMYDDGYPRDPVLARFSDYVLKAHAERTGGPAKDAAEAEIRYRIAKGLWQL